MTQNRPFMDFGDLSWISEVDRDSQWRRWGWQSFPAVSLYKSRCRAGDTHKCHQVHRRTSQMGWCSTWPYWPHRPRRKRRQATGGWRSPKWQSPVKKRLCWNWEWHQHTLSNEVLKRPQKVNTNAQIFTDSDSAVLTLIQIWGSNGSVHNNAINKAWNCLFDLKLQLKQKRFNFSWWTHAKLSQRGIFGKLELGKQLSRMYQTCYNIDTINYSVCFGPSDAILQVKITIQLSFRAIKSSLSKLKTDHNWLLLFNSNTWGFELWTLRKYPNTDSQQLGSCRTSCTCHQSRRRGWGQPLSRGRPWHQQRRRTEMRKRSRHMDWQSHF